MYVVLYFLIRKPRIVFLKDLGPCIMAAGFLCHGDPGEP